MGGDVRVILCLVLVAATSASTPGVAVEGFDPSRGPQQEADALSPASGPLRQSSASAGGQTPVLSEVGETRGSENQFLPPGVGLPAVVHSDTNPSEVLTTVAAVGDTVDAEIDSDNVQNDVTTVESDSDSEVVPTVEDDVTTVDSEVVPTVEADVTTVDSEMVPTVEDDVTTVDSEVVPTVEDDVTTVDSEVVPTVDYGVTTVDSEVVPTVDYDVTTVDSEVVPTVDYGVTTVDSEVVPTVDYDVTTVDSEVVPTVNYDVTTVDSEVVPTVEADVTTVDSEVVPTVEADVNTVDSEVVPTVDYDVTTVDSEVVPTVYYDVTTVDNEVMPTVGEDASTVETATAGRDSVLVERHAFTRVENVTAGGDTEDVVSAVDSSEDTVSTAAGDVGVTGGVETWGDIIVMEDPETSEVRRGPHVSLSLPGGTSTSPASSILLEADRSSGDERQSVTSDPHMMPPAPLPSAVQEGTPHTQADSPIPAFVSVVEEPSVSAEGGVASTVATVAPTDKWETPSVLGRPEEDVEYDLILETVVKTVTLYQDEASLQSLETSRRLPRTVSPDLVATPAELNNVLPTDQYRGFLSHSPSLSTFMSVTSHYPSELRKSNRKSDPEPDIDDIIKGIVQLLGGNVKVTAADVTNTRLTTFGNSQVTSSRINNRGPPRLTKVPFGLLSSVVHSRPPIRPPVTPPINVADLRPLPGRPQFVANTRPPFMVPLPPSLATRPAPPLQRPYATGIPLPIDLLPHSGEEDNASPEVVVNPAIPGLPDKSGQAVASHPVEEGSSTMSSSEVMPSLQPTPTPAAAPADTITTFITIASTTSLGTLSSTTNLVSEFVSETAKTSASGPSNVGEVSPSTSRQEGVTDQTTITTPPAAAASDTSTTQATPETYLHPSMLDPSSTTIAPTPATEEEPQPPSTVATSTTLSVQVTSTTSDTRPSATPPLVLPTSSMSKPQPPTPSRPPSPPMLSLARPRPGVVLDDSNYRPGEIITGTVVPYDLGGSGDIFDVTVSAHQGFGGTPLSPTQNLPPRPNLGQPFVPAGALDPLLTTAADAHDAFVSIDGRKTYFSLFPTSTQAVATPQGGTVGTGVGVVIPEEDLPQGDRQGYYPSHSVPLRPTRRPTVPPYPHLPTQPPHQHPPTLPPRPSTQPQRPPIQPPTRPTRKPYTRRPTQPAIRIDTCIVGDDSTCQEKLGEVCRTEDEVSSCFCRPGTARRRPRTPCKRMVSLQVSLKVDRVGDQRIVWGGNYGNPESEEFRLLKWEARHAISNTMTKTPLGSAYLGNIVQKFYSLGGKVIVNSTINLEDLPTTRNRNIRQTLQRQIIQVIQSHANNIGNSALWVDGPLNPVPDVSDVNECGDASLHDCHRHATCINQFGTFTCRCLPGYTDRFTDDPEQVGRRCESCSSDYCNKRGECGIKDGHKVCQCRGSYYGSRCEIDGEVLGVAVGASVAAVVIIILTLIFLCMWSRRWKAQDRKTEVLARGAAGTTLGGFAVNVQQKGASSQQYGVTLEDRMRWAQLADTLSNQNIYAQQQHSETVGGMYTANSSDYLTSAATSTNPFSIYNRVTRALSNSTLAGQDGGFFNQLRKLFGVSKTTKDHRSSYMMTPQPNITFQQLMALHAQLSAQPEQLRGAGGPSVPPNTAPTPTPLFQHQRQVGASSSGYASLGTLGSTAAGQYGHQLSAQHFGLQHLNPMSHLTSIQQQQQSQQQHHRHKHGFGTQSTYGQFGPASFNTLSQGGVSRAPTLGARTPLPLQDVAGAATIGPMGGASVAPAAMLENTEDEVERPYHLPRPKSRGSLGDASDIYYEPDDLTTTRGPPDRPPPPIPRSSHPQTYNYFNFLH
ncbi:uncharacterized protein [Panulirus ornatus]|uniref:uncharacterized protein isoform X2 n=1 Tax=Panulirus ornatus TaxID=150431 RepID=UPI003A85AE66